MAKKRLISVSLVNGNFQYLEVEKQPAGFFPQSPPTIVTQEALMSACQKADEIYINSLFPTALYEWELFPRVPRRYLNTLVNKDAQEKLGIPSPVQVQFKTVQEVVDAGVTKWQVAYIAVEEENIYHIWKTFKSFAKKIRFISPLPIALASMIAQIDHPSENFLIVWVGEDSSVVTISNPEGLVKVARNVPIGLSRKKLPDSPEHIQQFSRDFSREISMTLTFFKQQFRETVPKALYFIGNNFLPDIYQKYPFAGMEFDTHFRLATSPVQGMVESEVNDNLHLIGNLFLPDAFNFLPSEEIIARRTNLAFRVAYALLAGIIVIAGLWGFRLTALKSDRIEEYNRRFSHLQNLQKEVKILREDVGRLKPFEGWKVFYENTFKNQPRWNMLLSELGLLLPPNILIEGFQVLPEKAAQGYVWNSQISGKIKAKNWQEGLNLLRQFGGALQSSPFFEVTNITYAPEKMETEAKTFDFQIALRIIAEESAHEI